MFYLKYRPQTINEIDTEAIRDQLKKKLLYHDLSHAWLLTGPKGTGKTSTARIIAKAINCDNNQFAGKGNNIEPCNQCHLCRTITKGTGVDIIEMDAASSRKIDDIRELIDRVKFTPVLARYKVYIIDEVHMLTNEAFNALLKTLEEPPASTIFILATTEQEKIPKTVASRCIGLMFAKASQSDVLRQLKRICKHEKIAMDESALKFIASHCDNSFRDAAKFLEDAVINSAFTIEKLRSLVGLEDDNETLLTLIDNNNLEEAIKFLRAYDEKGSSIKVLIESLLNQLHEQLLSKSTAVDSPKKLSLTLPQISQLIKLLTEAYSTLKYSPIEVLPLEIALVDYFNQKK